MQKVLIVATNSSSYEKKNRDTGLWLGELVHFLEPLQQAGYQCDVVSPKGGDIPIDPESLKPLTTDKSIRDFYATATKISVLKNTASVETVVASDYAAIYYTGGHGTMWDFPQNEKLQTISRDIYEGGGIVSAVCHGVSGLINIKLSDGSLLVKGKTITGYSDFEEVLAGVAKLVPFSLQAKLKSSGANYTKAIIPFVPYVRREGKLITGQNPFSTKAVAKAVIEMLSNN